MVSSSGTRLVAVRSAAAAVGLTTALDRAVVASTRTAAGAASLPAAGAELRLPVVVAAELLKGTRISACFLS